MHCLSFRDSSIAPTCAPVLSSESDMHTLPNKCPSCTAYIPRAAANRALTRLDDTTGGELAFAAFAAEPRMAR